MKVTKLIIAISELWNDKQVLSAKNCLLRGFEEINKKTPITDLIDHLKSNDFNHIDSESYRVQLLINVNKADLIRAIKDSLNFESVLLLYIGPVNVPWGHWILCDGIISAPDVIQCLTNENLRFVMATMSPCGDWLAAEKKHNDLMSIASYDMVECSNPIVLGLSDYVESICNKLSITPCSIKRPASMSFLKAAAPSVCAFLDKSSSAMPCLVLIDGFTMLFNVGYGRNPEMRHQLKYIAQVDSALLSHISCNNILALSCSAQDTDSVKINHLFLPYGVNLQCKAVNEFDNPYNVDLNNEVAKMLSGYGDRGTSASNLSVKGKSGAVVTANQVKPIQLYHKIGYGTLELIPLAPFEEDVDVKKFAEEFKKGKYANEAQGKPLPTSLSVLLIWRPYNSKMDVKRFLYIGPRSQLRKNLPSVVTALYNNVECLKQFSHLTSDTSSKKPTARKVPTTTVSGPAKAATKVNGAVVAPSQAHADKPPRPATASEATKKQTTAPPIPANGKTTQRPATANITLSNQKAKDAPVTKRPSAKVDPMKVHEPKKSDSPKTHELKKAEIIRSNESKKTEPSKVHDVKKTEQVKVLDHIKVTSTKKTESHPDHDPKKGPQKTANKATDHKPAIKHTDTKVNQQTGEDHAHESEVAINGNTEHSEVDVALIPDADVPSEIGKLVAVGTVECAITEHGEADFCDDTPEEYSAEQMKEMGLYDEDEDRSSAPVSDANELMMTMGSTAGAASGVGTDMSHLPMEGSIYEKNIGDEELQIRGNADHQWNPPLSLPMPTRDSVTGPKKPANKCASPIYVDCVCVPSDLDKEDLRCLFNCVRFRNGFLQLEKSGDLFAVLDCLMEEWSTGGDGETAARGGTTVLPSLEDEATVAWVHDNEARLSSAMITVAPGLSRCSILIGGERGDDECLGFRRDL